MCDSYPLFLGLCVIYIFFTFILPIFFFWPHFNFDTLFGLFVLLLRLREAFKLEPVKSEAALRVHIRSYFMYLFVAHRLLLIQESRQKRFSCSSTQEEVREKE